MKLNFIECNLTDIISRIKGKGAEFHLYNKITQELYIIEVDESLERVKKRLLEQFIYSNEDEIRKGVFLSRMMTNIDITYHDIYHSKLAINQENNNYYIFSINDVKIILDNQGE